MSINVIISIVSLVIGWVIYARDVYGCEKYLAHYKEAQEIIKSDNKVLPKCVKMIGLLFCAYLINYYQKIADRQQRIREIRREVAKKKN